MKNKFERVLVTGGAGYVGSILVPKLLAAGHRVRVLDLCWYGREVLPEHPALELVEGDIRDRGVVARAVADCDAVIHLACISNDPSFELDPTLGKSINLDCFPDLVGLARAAGVRRFIYASSSSVYGVKSEREVTEELPLEPLTDYSRYKAECEQILLGYRTPGFVVAIFRPATVCGYSPRLRLDLTVNLLTNHAINKRAIQVFGGAQMRPNIHVDDMAELYVQSLGFADEAIDGKTFNVGFENHTVAEIAEMVRKHVGNDVSIQVVPTNDNRSYHISSAKILRELGFAPRHTIDDAIRDLVQAFAAGQIPDALTSDRYYNVRRMKSWATQ